MVCTSVDKSVSVEMHLFNYIRTAGNCCFCEEVSLIFQEVLPGIPMILISNA
jgi:hypothetical protein